MEKNSTYEEIAESYVSLVIAEYPDATIVFDGYNSPSTKDMTHKRKAKSLKASPTIHINNDMKFGGDMKVFLSNNKNKQRFIHTLGEKLLLHGCRVIC